jgi:hypothetical protein
MPQILKISIKNRIQEGARLICSGSGVVAVSFESRNELVGFREILEIS